MFNNKRNELTLIILNKIMIPFSSVMLRDSRFSMALVHSLSYSSDTFSANFKGRFGSLRSVIPGFWSRGLCELILHDRDKKFFVVKDWKSNIYQMLKYKLITRKSFYPSKACSFAFFSSVNFFCNLSIVFLCIWMLELARLHFCCNICICVPRRFISRSLSFMAIIRLLKKQDIKKVSVIYQCQSNGSMKMSFF